MGTAGAPAPVPPEDSALAQPSSRCNRAFALGEAIAHIRRKPRLCAQPSLTSITAFLALDPFIPTPVVQDIVDTHSDDDHSGADNTLPNGPTTTRERLRATQTGAWVAGLLKALDPSRELLDEHADGTGACR